MEQRAKGLAAGLVALAALAALSRAPRAEESPAAQAGHNLYEKHCMLCHGLRGHGDGEFAAELRKRPADLTLIAQRRGGVFPEEQIREMIDGRRHVRGHGVENMPIWGEVFGRKGAADQQYEAAIRDKIDALLDYLKSIQQPPLAPPAKKGE